MLEFKAQDAFECLSKAKNFNAAVKGFLKREVQGNADVGRFAKQVRDFVVKGREEPFVEFVKKQRQNAEWYLYALGSYAFFDFISEVSEAVFDEYAQEFNATYDIDNGAVSFKDKSKFESIARQALELIDTQLKGSEYPKSDFMRNVLLTSVFDRALMDPLTPVVHRTWADN
ncbi:MAG: hypothetical protein KDD53_11470 [Bdellovibrionales bacterium]|nr:hypothetical protein [Bdellovibrionales bacterium]